MVKSNEQLAAHRPTTGPRQSQESLELKELGQYIVHFLLQDKPSPELILVEASVHRPRRGTVWVAVFTGPKGGQIWRSTGLTDRDHALLVARKWEAEARTERDQQTHARLRSRLRRSGRSQMKPLLSQKAVAAILGMSERGVREVERRALRKLANHPQLQRIWNQYLAGDLDEHGPMLTPGELSHTPT